MSDESQGAPGAPVAKPTAAQGQDATSAAQILALAKEIQALKERVSVLENEMSQLTTEVTGVGFYEHANVLWKAKRDGTGFEQLPYCPDCKVSFVDRAKIKLTCPECHQEAPFKPFKLQSVRDKLPK